MTLSYRALMLAAIRSGGTAVVQGSESFGNVMVGGIRYSGQSNIQIILRPKPVEILIEPVDKRIYEAWEPMPDADDTGHADLFGSPDPLAIHLVMHDESQPNVAAGAGGLTQPNTQIGGLIDVHLDEVSEQPGICMNYPEDAAAKKGLFFPEHQPTGIKWIDDQHVQTMSATAREAMVYVCARDTGAYGHLVADCEALGLEGKNYKTTDNFLSIPLDDDDNHIADQYEKANNIYDKKLPPDWDAEDKPAGWRSTGDGLSLYEEYRGFLVDDSDHNEKFTRLSQGKRKLFVYPSGADKEIYRKGAEIFRNASGMDVYYLHSRSRMKDLNSTAFPRWINFNKTLWSNYQQAGVWMQDLGLPSTAFTRPIDSSPDSVAQCPITVDSIIISRAAITAEINDWAGLFPPNLPLEQMGKKMKAACTNGHIDVAQAEATMQARKPIVVNELIMFSAAHELGHSVGGRHHGLADYLSYCARNTLTDAENDAAQARYYSSGDQDCLMRYWHFDPDWTQWMLFLSGKWNLDTPASGGKWGFCTEDLSNMHLKE